MDKYRRSYGQEGFVRRSYNNRKPPLGIWKCSIPAWEKKFCKTVGLLDWKAFLEKKEYVHMYDNILDWNDSAGEEAFRSAKKCFLAKLNGISRAEDIPDPDLYIDEIDWECQIDEELLLDLDCRSVSVSDENHVPVIIFGDSFIQNMPFFSTGWGTGWGEEMAKATGWGDEMPKATGWGDEEDIAKDHGNHRATGWGDEGAIPKDHDKENRDGDYPNNSWHLDKGGGWNSGWCNSQGMKGEADFNNPNNKNSDYCGSWRRSENNEDTAIRSGMSLNKAPRFHGESHKSNSSWNGRNQERCSWRQKNTVNIQPKRFWNSNAYRPNTHQASDNARQRWN